MYHLELPRATDRAAVVTFDPRDRILGRSADYPCVKAFDATALFEMITFPDPRCAVA